MARVDMSSSDAGHTLGHVNGSDLLLSGLAGVIGAALWTLAALCSGGHRRRYDGLKGMVELRQRFRRPPSTDEIVYRIHCHAIEPWTQIAATVERPQAAVQL